MRILLSAAFVVVVFSCACRRQAGREATSQVPEGKADDDANPYVEKANEAIQALSAGLLKALRSEMEAGGASSAVHLCRDEAQAITARVSREQGIALGRTSHRLRNPGNAAPPWAEARVRASADKKTREVGPHVVDLDDRIGVLKPINTMDLCTHCHGNPDEIEADVKQALDEAYPEDQALGFVAGELRGWMWAEVPKAASR